MSTSSYNILVPVDFTVKTKWAMTKAIELANNFKCDIHLVHVVSLDLIPLLPFQKSQLLPYDITVSLENAGNKLIDLKNEYRQHICGRGNIEISILNGNRSKELANYIKNYNIDLVVVGLPRFNLLHRILSSVSISTLARKTHVPILGVGSSGLISHFKKIVLPIHNELPMRSIKLATMLARSFRSTVYLVSLRKDQDDVDNIMNKTFQVIQSMSSIPVQCFLLEGKNLAKSTLEFSKRIGADLIMANPLKEFNMPGLWNRITKKLLSYGSRIPVITMEKHSKGFSA